jgi:L,D-transpeptidase YcbB
MVSVFDRPYLRVHVIFVALLAGMTLCQPVRAAAAGAGAIETELQTRINGLSQTLQRPDARDALATFYAARDFHPIWFDETGPTRNALLLISELAKAADWGMDAAHYKLPGVIAPMTQGRWSAVQTATAEFELSTAVLDYAREARGGRIAEPERVLSSYLDRQPEFVEPATVLATITASGRPDKALLSFQPQHEQFQKLRALYVKLRTAAPARAANAEVSADGPLLAPGRTHADVAVLRRRFAIAAPVEGDYFFDDALAAAVKSFQTSAGLSADGFVGRQTRQALRAGGADKIAAVLANMEEWRWMPADLGQTHLFINVPSFTVDLVEDGQTVLTERVITGKSATQTPIFSKELTTIVLKPLWYLPDSIKLEKLLASQRSGSPIENEGYQIKKGKKVVESWSVDWNTADLKDYAIFQPSGDGNALGDVKFLFPNKHSVYLHDTPNKALFTASERLFSHGCVRLRNPLSLAQRLLDNDRGSGTVNVKRLASNGPGNNVLTLATPVQVHVGYFTVWVDGDGEAQFLGDPYGHEQRITLALQHKWNAIEKGADHLAAVDTQGLKSVKVQVQANVKRVAASTREYPPPSGLTRTPGARVKYIARSERDSVGELMRSALQH